MTRTRVAVACVTTLAAVGLSIASGVGRAGATTVSVADETEYRAALTSLSGDSSGPHVIEIVANIVLAGSADPVYTGTQPLTINGNGFTIDGDGNSRILHVDPPSPVAVDLALNDLTVTNGLAVSGAGVAGPGPTTVVGSTFTNNDGPGGAVASTLSVTVTGSTFDGNDNTTGGAGAITTVEGVTVTDSTFTGNSPGAITAYAVGGGSTMPP